MIQEVPYVEADKDVLPLCLKRWKISKENYTESYLEILTLEDEPLIRILTVHSPTERSVEAIFPAKLCKSIVSDEYKETFMVAQGFLNRQRRLKNYPTKLADFLVRESTGQVFRKSDISPSSLDRSVLSYDKNLITPGWTLSLESFPNVSFGFTSNSR